MQYLPFLKIMYFIEREHSSTVIDVEICMWCLYFTAVKLKLIHYYLVGLSIHTFHGNFFVRSTDLLSLPNVNPDAGYAVQMSVEESLTDMQVVSFQSALLYTSSKGKVRLSQQWHL